MLKRICQTCFLTISLLVFLCTPSIAASFECAKAKTILENNICKNPNLNEADNRMGTAYFKLWDSLPPAEAKELKEEQGEWLEERNTKCGPDEVKCLLPMYEDRTAILTFRMSPRFANSPMANLIGKYTINNYMMMRVQAVSEERVFIEIGGAEPTKVNWVCNFSGTGTLKNNVVSILHESEHSPITFTFSGKMVEVKGESLGYFCGLGGSIDGKYVRISGGK
jgi:uncharacterized protein